MDYTKPRPAAVSHLKIAQQCTCTSDWWEDYHTNNPIATGDGNSFNNHERYAH